MPAISGNTPGVNKDRVLQRDLGVEDLIVIKATEGSVEATKLPRNICTHQN